MGVLELLAVTNSYDYSYTTSSTTSDADIAAAMAGFMVLLPLYLLLLVVTIVALWKVFTKAGKPGWAAIVPFYNTWVLAEVAGKPGWWGLAIILLSPIPIINIGSLVLSLLISIELAKKFGKSTVFGVVGLWLFSLVGYLILAFGDAKYEGSASAVPQSNSNPPAPETFNDKDSSPKPPSTPTPPPTNLVQ